METFYRTYPKSVAFDASKWHGGCAGVDIIAGVSTGNGLALFCPICRVVSDLEATGVRIRPSDAFLSVTQAEAEANKVKVRHYDSVTGQGVPL